MRKTRLTKQLFHSLSQKGYISSKVANKSGRIQKNRKSTDLRWFLDIQVFLFDFVQGGDLTRPYPARRPPKVAPCHLISTSYLEVLGLFRAFSTLYAIAVPPGISEDRHPDFVGAQLENCEGVKMETRYERTVTVQGVLRSLCRLYSHVFLCSLALLHTKRQYPTHETGSKV